jgi:hypothetical protein
MVVLKYYSVGVEEEVKCEPSLGMHNNCNKLMFNSTLFEFCILLKDITDLEELSNLLKQNTNKIQLYCTLTKEDKDYKGTRKLVWKNNNIAVSQGGIRLEFDESARNQLLQTINVLKNR